MKMTFSVKMASKKTNIRHNNRQLTEKEYKSKEHRHIIRERSSENIVVIQKDIKEAYHELFDAEIAEYNAKQKRKDRQIKDYYRHVQRSKTLNTQKEMIVGVGNKEDWDKLSFEDKKMAGKAIEAYIRDFIKNNPNLYVYNAVVHLDEAGAPHAHVNFIPLAKGYKNGLSVQPSFKKALVQSGYVDGGGNRGKDAFIAFRKAELERMEPIFKKVGIERKLGETNKIKDVREYKEIVASLSQARGELDQLRNKVISDTKKHEENMDRMEQEGREAACDINWEIAGLERELDSKKAELAKTNEELSLVSEENYYKKTLLSELEKAQAEAQNIRGWQEFDSVYRVRELNQHEVAMPKESFKKMKERTLFGGILDKFKNFWDTRVREHPFVKGLLDKISKLREQVADLTKENEKLKKEKEHLENELEEIKGDRYFSGTSLERDIEDYLTPDEKNSLYRTIRERSGRSAELDEDRDIIQEKDFDFGDFDDR